MSLKSDLRTKLVSISILAIAAGTNALLWLMIFFIASWLGGSVSEVVIAAAN